MTNSYVRCPLRRELKMDKQLRLWSPVLLLTSSCACILSGGLVLVVRTTTIGQFAGIWI